MGQTDRVGGAVDVLAVQAETLAATVVAGMIMEAAYRGVSVSAAEIAHCCINDPEGETACYFRRNAAGVVALFRQLQSDPEFLAVFPGSAALARVQGGAA